MSKFPSNKENIAEQQRRRITAFNCLMPLLLLVLSCTALIFGIREQTIKDNLIECAQKISAREIVSQDDAKNFYYPECYVAYFDKDGVLISDKGIGYFPVDMFVQLDDKWRKDRFKLADGNFAYRVVDLPSDNQYGAKKVMCFSNTSEYSKQYLHMIYICIGIFTVFFLIQIVIATVSAVYQIKPYTRALKKNKQLISDISHEFNTPLAVINSSLTNILTCPDKTVEDVSDRIAMSIDEVGRLKKMVKDMLFLSRSDNAKMVVERTKFSLSETALEMAEPFEMMAVLDKKVFKTNIQEGIIVNSDQGKIKQMLIILLDNALKYTRVNDSVTLCISENQNRINISVSDTGIGVSDDEISKLFERFYRADDARSKGGTGLGLAIVKAIADSLDAKVYAEHNVPRGLKIVFESRK